MVILGEFGFCPHSTVHHSPQRSWLFWESLSSLLSVKSISPAHTLVNAVSSFSTLVTHHLLSFVLEVALKELLRGEVAQRLVKTKCPDDIGILPPRQSYCNSSAKGCHTKIRMLKCVSYGLRNVNACRRKMLLGFVPSRSYFHTIEQGRQSFDSVGRR